MRNSAYLKMALNMLLHSKLRSWLTIIGIVIGVGAVVDPQVWQYMTPLETESGRMLKPSDKYVAVIGSGVASGIYDQDVGINQVITINGKSVRIVGILAEEGGSEDRQIYMPIDTAVYAIEDAEEDVFDSITVKSEKQGHPYDFYL